MEGRGRSWKVMEGHTVIREEGEEVRYLCSWAEDGRDHPGGPTGFHVKEGLLLVFVVGEEARDDVIHRVTDK